LSSSIGKSLPVLNKRCPIADANNINRLTADSYVQQSRERQPPLRDLNLRNGPSS